MLNFRGMRYEEMMEERGMSADHSSINQWAIRFLPPSTRWPETQASCRGQLALDETYIKVKGVWNCSTAPSTSRARPSTSC